MLKTNLPLQIQPREQSNSSRLQKIQKGMTSLLKFHSDDIMNDGTLNELESRQIS